jgi:hypothetical protein
MPVLLTLAIKKLVANMKLLSVMITLPVLKMHAMNKLDVPTTKSGVMISMNVP